MNNDYGIPSTCLQQLLDIFRDEPTIERAVLYGSRAKGNYREGSDIDIALFGNDLDFTLLTKLQCAYDKLNYPWKLDLTIHADITNTDLREHIERVGIQLHL